MYLFILKTRFSYQMQVGFARFSDRCACVSTTISNSESIHIHRRCIKKKTINFDHWNSLVLSEFRLIRSAAFDYTSYSRHSKKKVTKLDQLIFYENDMNWKKKTRDCCNTLLNCMVFCFFFKVQAKNQTRYKINNQTDSRVSNIYSKNYIFFIHQLHRFPFNIWRF